MTSAPLVQIKHVSKSYGGVRALDDVSFDIAEGEVHALCGENGAGKSTLNKILSGAVVPDSGEVLIAGARLPMGSVSKAERVGVAIVHQESVAFLDLDARDNIFVGREPRKAGGVLDRQTMSREAAGLLERLGESFRWDVPLRELTPAQRQMVGVARALSAECRLLIMDEPTAALSAREADALFAIIRQLRTDGVSVLYVSHRLAEVFAIADKVTVLRDGRVVGTHATSSVSPQDLVGLMVGREVSLDRPDRAKPTGEPKLEVSDLTVAGFCENVNLTVRAGEIVTLAGLVGAGRSEAAHGIFGVRPRLRGSVAISGRTLEAESIRESVAAGLAMVPEDRQRQGLALPMSVGENAALAIMPELSRLGVINRKREATVVSDLVNELAIKTPSIWAPVETLSGGNQQKVLLAKWLATQPQVLILDEPTRGVDVGAKAEVHRLVRDLADQGVAVLVISSDLPEVLALSDRIVVMREGRIAGELNGATATEQEVLSLALPHASEPVREESKEAKIGLLDRLAGRREAGVAALLGLTVVGVTAINPAFLSANNVRDMLVGLAPAAIVAVGMTLVILAREIDISVGSLLGLCAATIGVLASPERMGWPIWAAIAATLGLGLTAGLVNGALVAAARVPSIIVTLGMLTLLRGVTEVVMGGEWITKMPPSLMTLGAGEWLGWPRQNWTAIIAVGLAVFALAAGALLCSRTPLGRRIYAVGGSPRAAVLAGIKVGRVRLFTFGLTGLLVALAAVVSLPRLSVIESGIGVGIELLVVTCVVVGGTSIRGGRGSILGSAMGICLLGIVSTVLIFLRLGEMSTYWERAIQGAFIIGAVLMDQLSRRREVAEV